MPDLARRLTLYVSDLDGTLLATDGAVSERSADLLNAVIDEGGLVTFATARSFASARGATKAVSFALPLITYGGTMVASPDTGEASGARLLAASTVEHAIAVSEQHGDVQPILLTLEDGLDWLRWDPARRTPGTDRFVGHRAGDRRLRPITPDDPYDPASVFYVSCLAPRPALVAYRAELAPVLATVAHFLSEDMHTPGLDWFEFHSLDGTKAAAVVRLAAELGAERVVVFGDNHNDLPMFEIADEGYAMANAVDELKSIATGVLGHYDTDAVARWIAADYRAASVEP